MNELVSVMRAADAAARWHVNQRRKGAAKEPYINHILEVASLVTQATGGSDPDVVIAALLHDAIEDVDVTSEMIASQFGQHVADIVTEVTDDKSLPKAERKRKQVENALKKSPEAKLIKLADKTSNLRAGQTVSRLTGQWSDHSTMSNGPRALWLVFVERRRGWNSSLIKAPRSAEESVHHQ